MIEKDSIDFLEEKNKDDIKEKIIELRDEDELHEQIEAARDLWKSLFEASMVFIDPNKQGYDDLFDYFDEFVEFEELIFASDDFYRDHTLHSLWVYFLGEYIFRKEKFQPLFKQYQSERRYLKKLSDIFKELDESSFEYTTKTLDQIARDIEYDDSVRCVMALTHDLGYPLKKINKINESISRILPFYSIKNFGGFKFQFEEVQNIYLEKFLETLSFGLSISQVSGADEISQDDELMGRFMKILNDYSQNVIEGDGEKYRDKILDLLSRFGESEKKSLQKYITPSMTIIRDQSQFMRLADDFESYKHGIMSAYLLTKTVDAFSDIGINYTENGELINKPSKLPIIFSKLRILKGMANHTSEGYSIKGFENSIPLFVMIDELEEFSRISRASQNRQFVKQFCETDIDFKNGYMIINFIFDEEGLDVLDPEIFFKDKCKRLLTLFDLSELESYMNIKFMCKGESDDHELVIDDEKVEIIVEDEEKDIEKYLESKEFSI